MLNCMIGGCAKMILSNEKKFIYLRVPKTGSTSASVFFFKHLPLENSVIRTSDNSAVLQNENQDTIPVDYFSSEHKFTGGVHATLNEVIALDLIQGNIKEFDVYGVCRNPIDRLISFCSMFKKTDNVDILSNFSLFKQYMSIFECSPQSLWLDSNVNKLFLYEDIESMIKEVSARYGVDDISTFKTYNLRSYKKSNIELSNKVLEYIKIIWADDFTLYNNLVALKKQK
jgi:hypothetical protein